MFFKYLLYVALIIIALLSFLHVDFPYRKTILFSLIIVSVIIDIIFPLLKKLRR